MVDARPFDNNLPAPLTSFIGRARELAEVRDLLRQKRLLTLTGSGGCGKSRLAVRVATDAIEEFPDGVWWVELAPIGEPGLVAPVLAQVMGVRPMPGETELEAVTSYLRSSRALVLLDNCEHVLEGAARVAEAVARGSPHLRVVATSREPLHAEGETEWRVPSLSLPPYDAGGESADASDAVRLFVERSRQVRPGFEVTAQNAPAIVAVCRELDGMPLAIELAAARLRAFSVEQIAGRLADRFRLLAGGTRTTLPRQRTLHASVGWSHDLLSAQERTVFRRLGVFMGGFTLEAAEVVCSGEDHDVEHVLDIVVRLVEKSLVEAEERGSAVRYRLLETVRQYALERLEDEDEAEQARDRHCDFYLELAERIEPELTTPRQPAFLDVLDPEAANLALAIERAATTEPNKSLRLSVALTLWWRTRNLFAQGEMGFTRALAAATEPSVLRCRALWGRAFLLTFAGAWEEALPAAQRALDASEEASDHSTTARALWLIGITKMWPNPVASRPELERARHLAATSGDDLGLMHATQALGMTYTFQEDIRARPLQEEALRLAKRLGQQDAVAFYWAARAVDQWIAGDHAALREAAQRALAAARQAGDVVTESVAVCGIAWADIEVGQPHGALEQLAAIRERALTKGGLFALPLVDYVTGMAYAADGRLEDARSALETMIGHGAAGWATVLTWAHLLLAEIQRLLGAIPSAQKAAGDGLELAHLLGNRPRAADAHLVLGRLAAARGEWAEAQRLLHEALPVAVESGTPRPPRVLEALAEVAVGLESHTEAARILGAATRWQRELRMVPWPHQHEEAETLRTRVRDGLGAEAFEEALAEGQAMAADEAVAYVRRARGKRRRPSAGWDSLTPTELEVARHTASGLTNAEIAERMFVSPVTVRTHLTHIFTKLGLKNRSQLTREVVRRADTLDG